MIKTMIKTMINVVHTTLKTIHKRALGCVVRLASCECLCVGNNRCLPGWGLLLGQYLAVLAVKLLSHLRLELFILILQNSNIHKDSSWDSQRAQHTPQKQQIYQFYTFSCSVNVSEQPLDCQWAFCTKLPGIMSSMYTNA